MRTVPACSVGVEVRRLFAAPRAELQSVAVGAMMVLAGWLLLPDTWRDLLFDRVPGPVAFAVVLEAWLLSDVTATNLFGRDARRTLEALECDGGVRRLTRAKTAATAVLIGTLCLIVGIVEAAAAGQFGSGVEFAPVLLAAPFGVLAVTSWFGVLVPYRAVGWRRRWDDRHRRRDLMWWLVAVSVPVWLGGAVMSALVVPAFAWGVGLVGDSGMTRPGAMSTLVAAAVVCGVCAIAYLVATAVTGWLATAMRRSLVATLSRLDRPSETCPGFSKLVHGFPE